AAVPIPIDTAQFDALDAEIRSVLPAEKVITPDEIRGTHATLEEAIKTDGWPTLRKARGRVLFTLDNSGKRDAYIAGHPSLAGRVLFTNAEPGDPDAAFVERNDSIGSHDEIQQLVAAGYVVRSRADSDTSEARANNTQGRDAAISSGAQWVSTDYPVPDPQVGTDYQVVIPTGMPGRCNPINAPADCTSLDIENPAHLESK
ncbi:MAG TPA: Ca2+-dependent phosphoinositide-specific phospholipase C, partial [Candidatus Acidoferrales bacterium]|nr:Ca2+-dependent phosphoinositide-specific phospholipase C [Candidatus Acidoferrales bacterium]